MGFKIGQEPLHLCVLGTFPGTCAARNYIQPTQTAKGNLPVFHAGRPSALSYNKLEVPTHLKKR